MNIRYCPLFCATDRVQVRCPGCHSYRCRKHGTYMRKGFHLRNSSIPIPILVQRYRCLSPQCRRCTFSVLPMHVLRYCRFFWPCLHAVQEALTGGATPYQLANHVWHVGRGVIVRAAELLEHLCPWVSGLHRELTDGRPERKLAFMVQIIIAKLGRLVLIERWYRHRYPLRFF